MGRLWGMFLGADKLRFEKISAHRCHLSAMPFQETLSSGLRASLAMNSHSAACFKNSSGGCIGSLLSLTSPIPVCQNKDKFSARATYSTEWLLSAPVLNQASRLPVLNSNRQCVLKVPNEFTSRGSRIAHVPSFDLKMILAPWRRPPNYRDRARCSATSTAATKTPDVQNVARVASRIRKASAP